MADSSLRSLERAAADDPLARLRLIEARIKAGGRDPRRDPRWGDSLTAPNSRGPVARVVEATWPRRLVSAYLPLTPDRGWGAWESLPQDSNITQVESALNLDATYATRCSALGSQVLSVEPSRVGQEQVWRIVARPTASDPWARLISWTREPETEHSSAIEPEEVEWRWEGRAGHYRRQRSTLDSWRRWAKRASVTFVGLACCVCAAPLDRGGVKDEAGHHTCHGCEA